jgi:hypothetical protein
MFIYYTLHVGIHILIFFLALPKAMWAFGIRRLLFVIC